MSMVVAHNITALNAQKNLYTANRNLGSSLSKLSSGFRINTGQDGPADLVISEQLRSQVNGLERAVRNTTEALNVLTIAEGALNEMNSILKKMKALAIHAASSGVTSPDQVAADQAEMDSSIQTLERISNTTKYSDQFLLNGAKDLTYNVDTSVKGTQNNQLVNTGLTNFQQIFKRDGYQVSIGYTGAVGANSVTAIGNAAMAKQAAKAYLEIDAFDGTKSQIDKNGNLTQGQSFILTGTLGSRQFRFSEGAHVSEIVSAIHNVAGSTGVDASLIFNRNQQINVSDEKGEANGAGRAVLGDGNSSIVMYDNYRWDEDNKAYTNILDDVEIDCDIIYGKNTDGNGDIFLKVISNDGNGNISYELYKDASLSKESLIGSGTSGTAGTYSERNNSGLTDFDVTFTANSGTKYGDVVRISTGNIALTANSAAGAQANHSNVTVDGSAAQIFDMGCSTASGVQLGKNTSEDGKIFFKVVYDENGTHATVYAYNNSLMRDQDMVAKTIDKVDMRSTANGNEAIILDSIWNDEKTANTGLGITFKLDNALQLRPTDMSNQTYTMEMQFNNLGARIYSSEYGSDQYVKVQQFEGGIFVDYEDAANYDSAKLVEANTTFQKNGQDATITVNGQQMKTNGLNLNLATPDVMASVTFNAGKTGTTTLAQVGYGEGTIFNKATSLTLAYALDENGAAYLDSGSNKDNNAHYTALLNNACHNTKERVGNFNGGMQLQLGEGSGDQERTVLGLKSMSTALLGRLELTGQWDPSKAVISTKVLCIQDVMGGQVASLSANPTVAMKIIDKAINDVSEMRAQIGAVQANMLQTNENNLRVAIENITKTESAIRDTDMASEMTAYTSAQIMSNAGVSMLGQANQQAQMVMGLLQ